MNVSDLVAKHDPNQRALLMMQIRSAKRRAAQAEREESPGKERLEQRRAEEQRRREFRNVKVPDNLTGLTKEESEMSDEEFFLAIEAQARQDALEGKRPISSRGYKKLHNAFVAVRAPDRRALMEKAVQQWRKDPPGDATVCDEKGNPVAHYSPRNGWSYITAPAEGMRAGLCERIYAEAYSQTKKEMEAAKGVK